MNFTPKNIFKTKSSDGSTSRTEEWDFNTLANVELVSFLIMMVAFVVVGALVSPIMLIILLFSFNGRLRVQYIVGAILALYFLIDCYNGWLCFGLLNIFCSESTMNFLITINMIAFVGHFIMIFAGWSIYHENIIENKNNPFVTYTILLVIFIVIGYAKSTKFTDAKKGWVMKHKKEQYLENHPPVEKYVEGQAEREYEEKKRKDEEFEEKIRMNRERKEEEIRQAIAEDEAN